MESIISPTGATSGGLFRLLAYAYLRWIPGRFGPYLVLPFLLSAAAHAINWPHATTPEVTPAEKALVPHTPDAPTFAQVTAVDEPQTLEGAHLDHMGVAHSDVTPAPPPAAPATPGNNGSVRRKKKKGGNNSGNNSVVASPANASDTEQAMETRRKLAEAAPLPKPTTTLGQTISSLIFGAPSPSKVLNAVAIGTNLLLLAAVLDSVWSPILGMDEFGLAFARVGAVDHHSVKIAARVPPTSSLLIPMATNASNIDGTFHPVEEFRGVKVVYRPTKPVGKWITGTDLIVDERKDWTGVVKIDGLWASTEYEFRLLRPSLAAAAHPAFPHSNFFTTTPDPALSSAASPGAGTHFTFASSSCVKPGFPYSGPWSKKVTKGAGYLKTVGQDLGLKFVLFVGDFIYADVPYYPDAKLSTYHKRYRQTFASPEIHALATSFPFLAIGDDHEIYNDFDSNVTDPAFAPANSAYNNYLGAANPDPIDPGTNYYEFRHGDAAFFVWDTRTYRSPDGAEDDEDKTMLGLRQREVFLNWAARVNNTVTWKFVVSSVPLMSLWSHGSDTWAGFTTERDIIMDVLEYVPNVIAISGDRHEHATASIRNTVTEFSTSPLNMFYLPFRTLSQRHGRGATGEDQLLKYIPDGNSKFTTFEVDTRIVNEPVVRAKVYVDGVEAWAVEVQGKPLAIPPPPSAIGGLGKSLLELLGFKRRSWF